MQLSEQLIEETQTVIDLNERVLRDAVAIVSPDAPETLVTDVFPGAGKVRREGEVIPVTAKQESDLREAMAELGFGLETDRNYKAAGLRPGFLAIIEGGLLWKVVAERELAAAASAEVLLGTEDAKIIKKGDEIAFGASRGILLTPETTEYEGIRRLVSSVSDVTYPVSQAFDEEDPGYRVGTHDSGQFVRLPSGHRPLILAKNNDVRNEDGSVRRRRPDTAAWLGIMDRLIHVTSGNTDVELGFVTSRTYQPSRELAVARFALTTERKAAVLAFGTERLAAVKFEDVKPPVLANLLGEINQTAKQLDLLKAEFAAKTEK